MKYSFKTPARRNRSLFRINGVAPENVFERMPDLRGEVIHVTFRPMLTAYRGKLLSKSHKGDAVYAGSFLRKRRIVLEEQMLKTPRVLERIFVHEVFHFVWSKASKSLRESYEDLIAREVAKGRPGELGWSAECLKIKLTPGDRAERSRRWKDYLCESFCDSAGWYFGTARRYSEMTLDRESRRTRINWLRANIVDRQRPLAI
jgi:hypothetical protein